MIAARNTAFGGVADVGVTQHLSESPECAEGFVDLATTPNELFWAQGIGKKAHQRPRQGHGRPSYEAARTCSKEGSYLPLVNTKGSRRACQKAIHAVRNFAQAKP
jgi:hypothetical protein